MKNLTAYVTYNYRNQLYTSACQLDSLKSLYNLIEQETREFGLKDVTFNFDGETERDELLQAEVKLYAYSASEEARACVDALDVIDSMHVHVTCDN